MTHSPAMASESDTRELVRVACHEGYQSNQLAVNSLLDCQAIDSFRSTTALLRSTSKARILLNELKNSSEKLRHLRPLLLVYPWYETPWEALSEILVDALEPGHEIAFLSEIRLFFQGVGKCWISSSKNPIWEKTVPPKSDFRSALQNLIRRLTESLMNRTLPGPTGMSPLAVCDSALHSIFTVIRLKESQSVKGMLDGLLSQGDRSIDHSKVIKIMSSSLRHFFDVGHFDHFLQVFDSLLNDSEDIAVPAEKKVDVQIMAHTCVEMLSIMMSRADLKDYRGSNLERWAQLLIRVLFLSSLNESDYVAVEGVLERFLGHLKYDGLALWSSTLQAIPPTNTAPKWASINVLLLTVDTLRKFEETNGLFSSQGPEPDLQSPLEASVEALVTMIFQCGPFLYGATYTSTDILLDSDAVTTMLRGLIYVNSGRFCTMQGGLKSPLSSLGEAVSRSIFPFGISDRWTQEMGKNSYQRTMRWVEILLRSIRVDSDLANCKAKELAVLTCLVVGFVENPFYQASLIGEVKHYVELESRTETLQMYATWVDLMVRSFARRRDPQVRALATVFPDLIQIYARIYSSAEWSLDSLNILLINSQFRALGLAFALENTTLLQGSNRVASQTMPRYCLHMICASLSLNEWREMEAEAWSILFNVIVCDVPALSKSDRSFLYKLLFRLAERSQVLTEHLLRALLVRAFQSFRRDMSNGMLEWSPAEARFADVRHDDMIGQFRLLLKLLKVSANYEPDVTLSTLMLDGARSQLVEYLVDLRRARDDGHDPANAFSSPQDYRLYDCSDVFAKNCCTVFEMLCTIATYSLSHQSDFGDILLRTSSRQCFTTQYISTNFFREELEKFQAIAGSSLLLQCPVPNEDNTRDAGSTLDVSVFSLLSECLLVVDHSGEGGTPRRGVLEALSTLLLTDFATTRSQLHTDGSQAYTTAGFKPSLLHILARQFQTTLSNWKSVSDTELDNLCVITIGFDAVPSSESPTVSNASAFLHEAWGLYLAAASEDAAVALINSLEVAFLRTGHQKLPAFASLVGLKKVSSSADVDFATQKIRVAVLRLVGSALARHRPLAGTIDTSIQPLEDEAPFSTPIPSEFFLVAAERIVEDLKSGMAGQSGGITVEIFEHMTKVFEGCVGQLKLIVQSIEDVVLIQRIFERARDIAIRLKDTFMTLPQYSDSIIMAMFPLGAATMPSLCSCLFRRLFHLEFPSMGSMPNFRGFMDIYRGLMAGLFVDCYRVALRLSRMHDPQSISWEDLVGVDHGLDSHVPPNHVTQQKAVPGHRVDASAERLSLSTREIWLGSLSAIFRVNRDLWGETSSIVTNWLTDLSEKINIHYSPVGIYINQRQVALGRSLRDTCLMVSMSSDTVAPASALPTGHKLALCSLCSVAIVALRHCVCLIADLLTGKRGLECSLVKKESFVEAISALSAYLLVDGNPGMKILMWVNIELDGSASLSKKKCPAQKEFMTELENLRNRIQCFHWSLSRLSQGFEAVANYPKKSVHLSYIKSLDSVLEDTPSSHLLESKMKEIDAVFPPSRLLKPLGPWDNLGDVRVKRKYRRRKRKVAARSGVVSQWMREDEKMEEADSPDAYVDMEDFIVPG